MIGNVVAVNMGDAVGPSVGFQTLNS